MLCYGLLMTAGIFYRKEANLGDASKQTLE